MAVWCRTVRGWRSLSVFCCLADKGRLPSKRLLRSPAAHPLRLTLMLPVSCGLRSGQRRCGFEFGRNRSGAVTDWSALGRHFVAQNPGCFHQHDVDDTSAPESSSDTAYKLCFVLMLLSTAQ